MAGRSLPRDAFGADGTAGPPKLMAVNVVTGAERVDYRCITLVANSEACADPPFARLLLLIERRGVRGAIRRVGVRLSGACAAWQSRSPTPTGGGPTVCLCIDALQATILTSA